MAATLVPITERLGAEAREVGQNIAADPVEWTLNTLIKLGSIFAIIGGTMMLAAPVLARQEQGFLNDIQGRLGLAPSTSPIPPKGAKPAPPPPPPPPPIQIQWLNDIIWDINLQGSVDAAQNFLYFQGILTNLWNLANLVYAPIAQNINGIPVMTPTKRPVGGSGNVPTIFGLTTPANGLGPQLSIAIIQCCDIMMQLEGSDPQHLQNYNWENWQGIDVYGQNLCPDQSVYSYDFLLPLSQQLLTTPFHLQQSGTLWGTVQAELSDVSTTSGASFNFKATINGLCAWLNASQPWNVTPAPTSNNWGPLGVFAADLGAIGSTVETDVTTFVNTAAGDIKTFVGDLSAIAGDIGTGIAVFGRFILNAPFIFWDALGYGVTWTWHTICEDLGPLLLGAGLAMVIVGAAGRFAYHNIYPKIHSRVVLAANARAGRMWAWVYS